MHTQTPFFERKIRQWSKTLVDKYSLKGCAFMNKSKRIWSAFSYNFVSVFPNSKTATYLVFTWLFASFRSAMRRMPWLNSLNVRFQSHSCHLKKQSTLQQSNQSTANLPWGRSFLLIIAINEHGCCTLWQKVNIGWSTQETDDWPARSSHDQVSQLADIECKIRQCQFLPEKRVSAISVRRHAKIEPWRKIAMTWAWEILPTDSARNIFFWKPGSHVKKLQKVKVQWRRDAHELVEVKKMKPNIKPAAKQLDGA